MKFLKNQEVIINNGQVGRIIDSVRYLEKENSYSVHYYDSTNKAVSEWYPESQLQKVNP